jgi:hypothetical protein
LLGRDKFTHLNLLNFIRNDGLEDYKDYFRISDENLNYVVAKVNPLIVKQYTVKLNAITPEAHIIATLLVLATAQSFEGLKFARITSPQALGKIIPETCNVIYKAPEQEYLKVRKLYICT